MKPQNADAAFELDLAVELCLKQVNRITDEIAGSRSIVWPILTSTFGEAKAEDLFQQIIDFEKAYFSIHPKGQQKLTLVEELQLVKDEFLQKFPNAPQKLVYRFGNRYAWNNR